MTTSVELRGGPLDGQVMELSIAEYRLMMQIQGGQVAGYLHDDDGESTRCVGRYRVPTNEDNVADFIGEDVEAGEGLLPPFRDWPRT